MDDSIRDIGRPRLRSSRPTPPPDGSVDWAEGIDREDLIENEKPGAEFGREAKLTRH